VDVLRQHHGDSSAVQQAALRKELRPEYGTVVLAITPVDASTFSVDVTVLDPESDNEFIGYDLAGCFRVRVSSAGHGSVSSTDLDCPGDALFSERSEEERSTDSIDSFPAAWPLSDPGTRPDDAHIVHVSDRHEENVF
jgi:hypothetical protein